MFLTFASEQKNPGVPVCVYITERALVHSIDSSSIQANVLIISQSIRNTIEHKLTCKYIALGLELRTIYMHYFT